MTLTEYIKSKIGLIFLNIILLIVLVLFLFSAGNTFEVIKVVIITWIAVVTLYIAYEYKKRKIYFDELEKYTKNIDKKYLLSEVVEMPQYIDAIPYYYLLKEASKFMREEINEEKERLRDYKEYIEKWVHEVKTPISLIKLIEENNKTPKSKSVLIQLEEIDRYIDQALFYARSEDVEKDYLVKEISLQSSVHNVISKNKQGFILNRVELDIDDIDKYIYSDSKWIEFIIEQIIINSIKYKNEENPIIKITSKEIKNGVQLVINDNGIGIEESEISRVFEKGFTGNIGRTNNKSTGIGLYLCKKLCDKLGLLIDIKSKKDVYTEVTITFPKGNFVKFD